MKHKIKKVSTINKNIIKKYNLEIANPVIVQSLGLISHTKKTHQRFS